ncbi:Glutamate receptor ionotropic, NMDA 2B [Cichlidogyrus casuarinus]|uniref:Glutamate receptor ionotropic, NMDA 2B n=1 Tax=Cichlidogyrus casuarinus TaxID=1844966 RepID=A0ABD2PYH5_9PLAT
MIPCSVRAESAAELLEKQASEVQNTTVCCHGLTIDMLIQMMKDLDFDVDMYEVPDGYWGGLTDSGWNGIVKEILDKKADMAVTSLKITPKRSEKIEFSVPFLETGIGFLVAVREGAISPTAFLSESLFAYALTATSTEPYDYQTWCVILVFSVHATGTALFIYEWLSPQGLDRGNLTVHGKFPLN